MSMIAEWLVAFLLVVGGSFAFVAALGVVRLPDLYIRMHASTKAGTLGAGLIFVAAAIHFGDTISISLSVLTILFLLLTAPVAAHAIGRAAYRSGTPLWEGTLCNELERADSDK
jgi:multicomponent Na+:H+ antiporter subunit G